MTDAEIRDEILDILSDIAPDEDLSTLADDKPFREQLELDSMDFLDIVMELRKQYRIQIPEADYEHLISMSSTVQYLQPLLNSCYVGTGLHTDLQKPTGENLAGNFYWGTHRNNVI